MANPLHDNPKSKPSEKDEPRNDKGQTQGEERDDVSDKSPIGEGGAEGGDKDSYKEPAPYEKSDMFLDGLKAIHKRHEQQRRDHHQAHRESLRQMTGHHAKEISDHFGLTFGADGKSEGTPEKPAAAPAAAPAGEE